MTYPPLNFSDPQISFRKAMLTRLACFADSELHRKIGHQRPLNGLSDLSDVFDYWDDGPKDPEIMDDTLSAAEFSWLADFDTFLDENYWGQPDFWDSPAWSWLFDSSLAPPQLWNETVRRAQEILSRFPDFNLQLWRESNYRVW